jgi:TetR/AcrR family transcriptional regulator, fatty acid metabolism regulator protein
MRHPPPDDEKETRRRAILDAAVETFAERGFSNSRTRAIAQAAGVGEGTIYLYFEGKDDLLLTAFQEKVTEFCEAAESILPSDEPFERRLTHFIELQFAGIESDPDLATVLLLESRQSTKFYGERVREVLRAYAAAVDRLIESGIAEGTLDAAIDVPLARRLLIGGLEEIALDWLLGQRARPLAPLAGPVALMLLNGLGRRADG